MTLTNVGSITDANSVYVCQVKDGCTMYIPFFSDNAIDDRLFRESVAQKIDVVDRVVSDIEPIEEGYYFIKGIGVCSVYYSGNEVLVDVYGFEDGNGRSYTGLVAGGYQFHKIDEPK